MGITSKTVTIATAFAGLAAVSQAPEYAQQYRQRIGGAIDELRVVVNDFDRDASASGLDRDQAIEQMRRSAERFPRDRGESMARTIDRYEALLAQRQAMDAAHPLTRPLFVLRYPDPQIMQGAWSDFEPAVPLTTSGAVYGGIGGLIAALLARFGIGTGRMARRRRADRRLARSAEQGATVAVGEGRLPPDVAVTPPEGPDGRQGSLLDDWSGERDGEGPAERGRFGYRPRDKV